MQPRKYARLATRTHTRFTAYLAAALLFIAMAAPTYAQASKQFVVPQTNTWWAQHLGEQLAVLLASPIEANKQRGLEYAIQFSSIYDSGIDLSEAVPQLLEIYNDDAREGYRLMALSALHGIGDQESMYVLLDRLDQEASPRIRRLTLATLASYAQDHKYFRESVYVQTKISRLNVGP